ncbi:MAG: DUF5991 domain-containing protein [Patescibacteria group bacterium]
MKMKKKRTIINLVAVAIALIAILIAYMCSRYATSNPNGTYEFGEYVPPNQTWSYVVTVKNEKAHVSVDGFQTMKDINAAVVQNGSGFDVVFDSYGEKNTLPTYEKGDVLFTFYPANAGMQVVWKKMQPNLDESKDDRVFTKMK